MVGRAEGLRRARTHKRLQSARCPFLALWLPHTPASGSNGRHRAKIQIDTVLPRDTSNPASEANGRNVRLTPPVPPVNRRVAGFESSPRSHARKVNKTNNLRWLRSGVPLGHAFSNICRLPRPHWTISATDRGVRRMAPRYRDPALTTRSHWGNRSFGSRGR